jgi:hypothetical protein
MGDEARLHTQEKFTVVADRRSYTEMGETGVTLWFEHRRRPGVGRQRMALLCRFSISGMRTVI